MLRRGLCSRTYCQSQLLCAKEGDALWVNAGALLEDPADVYAAAASTKKHSRAAMEKILADLQAHVCMYACACRP